MKFYELLMYCSSCKFFEYFINFYLIVWLLSWFNYPGIEPVVCYPSSPLFAISILRMQEKNKFESNIILGIIISQISFHRLSVCLFVGLVVIIFVRPSVRLFVRRALFLFVYCFAPVDSLHLFKHKSEICRNLHQDNWTK